MPITNILLIAYAYMFIGTTGFVGNVMLVVLITKYKKNYANPTYTFIKHSTIADNLALLGIAFCSWMFTVFPSTFSLQIEQLTFVFIMIGFNTGSFFVCMLSLSRYISITDKGQLPFYFSNRMLKCMTWIPWTFFTIYFFLWQCFVEEGGWVINYFLDTNLFYNEFILQMVCRKFEVGFS